MVNQSLLDDFECLSRVVVPMARCFSSDSYGGSVTTRSTLAAGSAFSQSTASVSPSAKGASPSLLTKSLSRAAKEKVPFEPSTPAKLHCSNAQGQVGRTLFVTASGAKSAQPFRLLRSN